MNAIWSDYLPIFLATFSALLPLINPIGTAMIIEPFFHGLSEAERKRYAFRIVLNCFVLGFVTVHIGNWILLFMGVSIPATQAAGGIVIAFLGYGLLNNPQKPANDTKASIDIASSTFYPLSFPLTVGPGSVSTLIALSANAHNGEQRLFSVNLIVITLALFINLVAVYFCFIYNNKISRRMGATGNEVVNRLLAFLVFCIGIQMAFKGVMGLIKLST
jgi:multiple antibiotic resistance protein